MRGFINHAYDPKRSTNYTTSLKNIPETLGFTPSLPNILNNRAQLFLSFRRFTTTAFQSSYDDVIIRTRYLNEVTKFSGLP